MNLGVDYAAGDAMILGKYSSGYRTSYGATNPVDKNDTGLKMKEQQGDTFVSSITGDVGSGNTCTDGKDDGKIGIGGVVANVAQGAVRTIPNMIKGAVLDSEGKISPLKIAATAATVGVCIAFPAVGLVACGIGAATGAVKIGSNVAKAMTAETDAEAKTAWENVGNGAVTTGLSVAGAKASYSAVQASAGGAESAISQLEGNGFMGTLKQNGIIETGKALAKDCIASSKNNGTNLASAIKNLKAKPESSSASETAAAEAKPKVGILDKIKSFGSKIKEKFSPKQETYDFSQYDTYLNDAESFDFSQYDAYLNNSSGSKFNILEGLKSARSKVKSVDIPNVSKSLGSKGAQAAKAIMDKSIPEESVIHQFGYETVGQVLKVLAGESSTDSSI